MRVTRHGEQRTRERLGIPKEAVEENSRRALERGIRIEQTTGRLRRHLDWLWHHGIWRNGKPRGKLANNIRVYHHNVYIFYGTTLVTVLKLPQKLCAEADKVEKRNHEKNETEARP